MFGNSSEGKKGKVEITLSQCLIMTSWRLIHWLIKQHAMKMNWGSGCVSPHILDLDTRWRWVVNFMLSLLYPWGKYPKTHWIGGWVGSRASLYAVMRKSHQLEDLGIGGRKILEW